MVAMAKEPIPTSRLRRSATVARLAAEQAAQNATRPVEIVATDSITAGLAALVVGTFVYSYRVWRDDPDRRPLANPR